MNKDQQKSAVLVSRAWSGYAVAAFVLLFFCMYTALVALVKFWKINEAQLMVFQTVAFHWAGLLFIAGHARSLKTNGSVLYGMHGPFLRRLGQIVKHYLLMMAIVVPVALGWGGLLKHFGVEPALQDVVTMILQAKPLALQIYLIFLAVVLAPVFEELVFRGILFPLLAKRMPIKTAAVLVSVFFALLHAHLPGMLPLVLVSLCLCYAYWRTGSLWVNIGMHMLFNGINLVFMFLFAS